MYIFICTPPVSWTAEHKDSFRDGRLQPGLPVVQGSARPTVRIQSVSARCWCQFFIHGRSQLPHLIIICCNCFHSFITDIYIAPLQGYFLLHMHSLANSVMMSTLTAHCQWEDEMAREITGHPPSYAVAKKMKSLTLHTHCYPRASLRDGSSFSSRLLLWNTSNPNLAKGNEALVPGLDFWGAVV